MKLSKKDQTKVFKVKLWSVTKADTKFSEYIRKRDGKCIRCPRTTLLQNSHFWSRGHTAVRFDPDNCDTLCYPCHYGNAKGWEYEKNGGYMEYKKKQLGPQRYLELEARAHQQMKRSEAIKRCMTFLDGV